MLRVGPIPDRPGVVAPVRQWLNRRGQRSVDAHRPRSLQSLLLEVAAGFLARAVCSAGELPLSVVVTTHNRASYLNLTLASLERQLLPSSAWEAVVADIGSRDETAEVLRVFVEQGRIHVVPVDARGHGRAAAMNEALRVARGAIVLFLGDDRILGSDFLVRHLLQHLNPNRVALGDSRWVIHSHLLSHGDQIPMGASARPALSPEDLDHPERWRQWVFPQPGNWEPLFSYFGDLRRPVPVPWFYLDAGNLSVPREAALAMWGFDEQDPAWSLGEWEAGGKEFGYRLYRGGLTIHFEPRARALRQLQPKRLVNLRERQRIIGYLLSKHPTLRGCGIEQLLTRDGSSG